MCLNKIRTRSIVTKETEILSGHRFFNSTLSINWECLTSDIIARNIDFHYLKFYLKGPPLSIFKPIQKDNLQVWFLIKHLKTL